MRYTINAETFITLPVTSGTIQNISNTDIEISDTQTVGSGIILKAGEYFSFHDATIYACARPVLDGGVGIISVVPFEEGGKGGGSGSDTYVLPTASESVKGGIKIGTGLEMTGESLGLSTASESVKGGAKIGTGLKMNSDTLELETASESVKGGIIVGAGLSMNSDTLTLNVGDGLSLDSDTLVLDLATESVIGGIKSTTVSGGVSVDSLGNPTINLPTASSSIKGGIKIGGSFDVDSDVLILNPASDSVIGGIKSSSIAGGINVDSVGNATINLPIASESVLGGVKSSTIAGGVSVDSIGNMSVNTPVASATNATTATKQTGNVTNVGDYNDNFSTRDANEWISICRTSKGDGYNSMWIASQHNSKYGGILLKNTDGEVEISLAGTVIGSFKGNLDGGAKNLFNWTPSTAYAVGDIAYVTGFALKTNKKLVCVKAGTSDSTLTLSSTGEGAYITDGTCAWVIDSLADGNYSAGHGNGVYRGVDVTNYWESGDMSANIQSGKFVGMHIGDWIVKSVTVDGTTYSNVKWILGDFDYHLHRGDTETTTHHVLVFPEGALGTTRMNPTNTTEGGYVASEMWTSIIPLNVIGIQTAFGSTHVLSHKEFLTNNVDMAAPSKGWPKRIGMADNWVWTAVTVNIFNEAMICGNTPFSSSGFDVGECNTQVAAMRLNKSLSFSRSGWCWLRSVASGTAFTFASYYGRTDGNEASNSAGRVRPYFLLY